MSKVARRLRFAPLFGRLFTSLTTPSRTAHMRAVHSLNSAWLSVQQRQQLSLALLAIQHVERCSAAASSTSAHATCYACNASRGSFSPVGAQVDVYWNGGDIVTRATQMLSCFSEYLVKAHDGSAGSTSSEGRHAGQGSEARVLVLEHGAQGVSYRVCSLDYERIEGLGFGLPSMQGVRV